MNKLKALLGFDPKTTTVKTELIAGMTTFLTMCYILAVNPTILATTGMDKGALFTATAIASAIATFLLAFMAKLPFAQAPSMGLNAFFAFTLCQAMGLTWQQALAVLLVEGIIFLAITVWILLLSGTDLSTRPLTAGLRSVSIRSSSGLDRR